MRIGVVITATRGERAMLVDSALLLASKLGRAAQRSKDMHVYLLYGTDGALPELLPNEDYMTTVMLPAHVPNAEPWYPGRLPSPTALVEFMCGVGLDALVVTRAEAAAVFALFLGGYKTTDLVRQPVLLWDFSPSSPFTVENRSALLGNDGALRSAAGYVLADRVIFPSAAAQAAAVDGVRVQFGWAAADAVAAKSTVCQAEMDRAYMEQVTARRPKRERFTVHIGGRWSATKNQAMVCRAVMKLMAAGHDIELIYTGLLGPGKPHLLEAGGEHVKGLSQEEMWGLMSSCHLGVIAQTTQAVPCFPLEQMVLGLPVLVRSTLQLPGSFAQYPLVFEDEHDLLQLMLWARDNYAEACAQCQEWCAAHLDEYDISRLVPLVRQAVQQSVRPLPFSSSAVVAGDGSVDLHAIPGRSGRMTHDCPPGPLIARRLALEAGYIEDLASAKPLFHKQSAGSSEQ